MRSILSPSRTRIATLLLSHCLAISRPLSKSFYKLVRSRNNFGKKNIATNFAALMKRLLRFKGINYHIFAVSKTKFKRGINSEISAFVVNIANIRLAYSVKMLVNKRWNLFAVRISRQPNPFRRFEKFLRPALKIGLKNNRYSQRL